MPTFNIGPTRDYKTLIQLTSASWLYPISAWGEPVEIVLDPVIHVCKTPSETYLLNNTIVIGDNTCDETSYVSIKALNGYEWRGSLSSECPTLSAYAQTTFLTVRPYCEIRDIRIQTAGHLGGLTNVSLGNVYSKLINCYLTGNAYYQVRLTNGGSCYNVVAGFSGFQLAAFNFGGSSSYTGWSRLFNCVAFATNASPYFYSWDLYRNDDTSPSSYDPLIVNCAAVLINAPTIPPPGEPVWTGFTSGHNYHIESTNNSTSDRHFIPNWNGSNGLSAIRATHVGWSDFEDFHISASSPWFGAGYPLSANFIKDIDNQIIQNWCIGVDDPTSTEPRLSFSVDKTRLPLDTGVRFIDESSLYPYFVSTQRYNRTWKITNDMTSASDIRTTDNRVFDYLFSENTIGGIWGDTVSVSLSAEITYDGEVTDLDWF